MAIKDKLLGLGDETSVRATAGEFKTGWDAAGRDGAVTPELTKALEEIGVHPERAQHYMDALMASKRPGSGIPNPDPKDYATPVVTPIGGKPKPPTNG